MAYTWNPKNSKAKLPPAPRDAAAPKAKTAADWEKKGWFRQIIGADPMEFSYSPDTHKLVVKGLFDAKGHEAAGQQKLVVESCDRGSMVSVDPPGKDEMLAVYRIVEIKAEKETEEGESDAE